MLHTVLTLTQISPAILRMRLPFVGEPDSGFRYLFSNRRTLSGLSLWPSSASLPAMYRRLLPRPRMRVALVIAACSASSVTRAPPSPARNPNGDRVALLNRQRSGVSSVSRHRFRVGSCVTLARSTIPIVGRLARIVSAT